MVGLVPMDITVVPSECCMEAELTAARLGMVRTPAHAAPQIAVYCVPGPPLQWAHLHSQLCWGLRA